MRWHLKNADLFRKTEELTASKTHPSFESDKEKASKIVDFFTIPISRICQQPQLYFPIFITIEMSCYWSLYSSMPTKKDGIANLKKET